MLYDLVFNGNNELQALENELNNRDNISDLVADSGRILSRTHLFTNISNEPYTWNGVYIISVFHPNANVLGFQTDKNGECGG